MRTSILPALAIFLCLSPVASIFSQDAYRPKHRLKRKQGQIRDKDRIFQKVNPLLARMTLEEKIGQTVLFTSHGNENGPVMAPKDLEDIRNGRCGNIFNAHTVAFTRKLQKIAVEETRLGIPLLFGYDVIHGHKTIFPIPLGEAASWDMKAIEKSARVAAVEASASGLHWTFAPMVDIARDPRWGRICEGAGEDPYLGSQIARARVQGFQGNDLSDPLTILACPKHFAAYGASQAGRDYHTVDLSERTLREVYLPPFRAAIDEGALSVMTAFNELNGVPATGSRFLLKDVLRSEWRFSGFVVSDYTSINEMVHHGTAADESRAGKQALLAGVDMDMQGSVYRDHLTTLVADGVIPESAIDDAVRYILRVKAKLGLFDDPFRYCDEEREKKYVYSKDHLKAAYEMACKSLVLLKNDNHLLPLKPGGKISVIGPLAESQRDLLGSWPAAGDWEIVKGWKATGDWKDSFPFVYPETILAGIERNNTGGQVSFAQGVDPGRFSHATNIARNSDLVVMVLGERWDMSGEAASRTSINLPGVQTELLSEVKKVGKPIILVLMNGRPLALEEESLLADVILEVWYPGVEGGKAVADTLFGKNNPSGKLPVTFPRNLGQVPIYYNMKNTGRPLDLTKPDEKYKSRYIDSPNDPLYPFGFGLSYTTFEYSNLELDKKILRPEEQLEVSVTVTNSGNFDGSEVVQLYIRDLVGSVTRPVKELKGFRRIELGKGKSRRVVFTVSEKELAFLRHDMTWGTESGEFEVFVGPNSRDLMSAKFKLVRD